MRVAMQIDQIEFLNPASDSSLVLGREALARNYELSFYTVDTMSISSAGRVTAKTHALKLYNTAPFFEYKDAENEDLSSYDFIFLRQNPPFNMAYISSTYALEMLPEKTRVINNPASVRNNPEKLLPLKFPQFIPPSLITKNEEEIKKFADEQGEIIIKPLYGYGGLGVFYIEKSQSNLGALLELLLQNNEPIIVQKFLPEVFESEKRVIIINGKIEGAFQRKPQGADIRSNMRVGGVPVVTTLSKKEILISEEVGEYCAKLGIVFVGLDLIGEYLNEVNITSPTGLMTLKNLYGTSPEKSFWRAIAP